MRRDEQSEVSPWRYPLVPSGRCLWKLIRATENLIDTADGAEVDLHVHSLNMENALWTIKHTSALVDPCHSTLYTSFLKC
jgi:hypothetical protein